MNSLAHHLVQCGHSTNDSSYYHSHDEQFGWKGRSERCPGELGHWAQEREQEGFVEEVTPDSGSPRSDSPCCTVSVGQSPGPGKCASTLGCYFGCSEQLWDWPPPGPWPLTVRPSKEQGRWHRAPWKWNLWEVWAPCFYLLFIPSIQVLVLLLYHKLVFLPHVLQGLNQIFPRSRIHLHVDLEVVWHMMFLHFLFNHKERK